MNQTNRLNLKIFHGFLIYSKLFPIIVMTAGVLQIKTIDLSIFENQQPINFEVPVIQLDLQYFHNKTKVL
jgi:hypothetical protein